MRPHHIIPSVLRAFAMLGLLIFASAMIECATTSTPAPSSGSSDAGADSSGCDVACANILNMHCNYADECPSTCRLIRNPELVTCMKTATTCLKADQCNQPKNP